MIIVRRLTFWKKQVDNISNIEKIMLQFWMESGT
jgi:hypothetical protein